MALRKGHFTFFFRGSRADVAIEPIGTTAPSTLSLTGAALFHNVGGVRSLGQGNGSLHDRFSRARLLSITLRYTTPHSYYLLQGK